MSDKPYVYSMAVKCLERSCCVERAVSVLALFGAKSEISP